MRYLLILVMCNFLQFGFWKLAQQYIPCLLENISVSSFFFFLSNVTRNEDHLHFGDIPLRPILRCPGTSCPPFFRSLSLLGAQILVQSILAKLQQFLSFFRWPIWCPGEKKKNNHQVRKKSEGKNRSGHTTQRTAFLHIRFEALQIGLFEIGKHDVAH